MALAAQSSSTNSDEDQWEIFTSLDLKSEAEQIKLASFLQTLIAEFGQDGGGTRAIRHHLNKDGDEDEDDDDDCGASGDGGGTAPRRAVQLSRGASFFEPGIEQRALPDYGPLPKGPLSPKTACDIIEVYRRGGKVSQAIQMKLTRPPSHVSIPLFFCAVATLSLR